MTAIAYRDGVMAADTAVWSEKGLCVDHTNKIVRVGAGLYGAAGGLSVCVEVGRRLAKTGESIGLDLDSEEDFEAIWVKSDGGLWWADRTLFWVVSTAPFAAIGAAEAFMHGAMHAGASAEQAVRLAIEHTDGAAGTVQVERLIQ